MKWEDLTSSCKIENPRHLSYKTVKFERNVLNKYFEKYLTNMSDTKTNKLQLDKTRLLQMLNNLLAHACWLWRFNESKSQFKIFLSIHHFYICVHLSICPSVQIFNEVSQQKIIFVFPNPNSSNEWHLNDKIHETDRGSCTGPAPVRGHKFDLNPSQRILTWQCSGCHWQTRMENVDRFFTFPQGWLP